VNHIRCRFVQHNLFIQPEHLFLDDIFHSLDFVLRVGFQDHGFLLVDVVKKVFACYRVQHTLKDI